MRPPKRIVMGPHTYRVRRDATTRRNVRETDDSCATVMTDHLEIHMDDERPHTANAESLLHELLHCAWRQAGLTDSVVRGAEMEERIVTALAPVVLHALRANPDLVDYLQAEP